MTNKVDFKQWFDAGYRDLLPVVPPDAICSPTSHVAAGRGKSPGLKYDSGLWGGFKGWTTHQTTDDDIDAWQRMGASIGLRFGGAWLLDLDIYDEATADHIEQEALAALGPAPMRVGQWPKRALLYRNDGTIKPQKLRFAGKQGEVNLIEIPPQAVVMGTHAKTGRPYEWRRPLVTFDKLTVVNAEQLASFMQAMRAILPQASNIEGASDNDVNQATLAGHVETIAQILTKLPNRADMRWDQMIKVGYAAKAALPNDPELAFELWDDWCSRWEADGYDQTVARIRWDSMKGPYRVGADWLYDLGDALLGKSNEFKAQAFLAPIDEPGETENPFAQSSIENAQGKTYTFEPFDDVVAGGMASNPALIKGLLDQGAMSVLYGDSNVGKTFVAMDMAFHIGAGLPYGGLRTSGGLVVYIAAEGGHGARKRLVALRERFPGRQVDFVLLASPVNLLDPAADVAPLAAAIRGLGRPVALGVIDTLSRAMAGGDENSSVDMGAMVRNMDALRKACAPMHLMAVHHTGKDKAKGARGHSLLRAATDTEIEVGDGLISVTKQRDMDKSWSSGFALVVHRLGIDVDGDVITSCTVRLESLAAVQKRELTEGEQAVLSALAVLSDTCDTADRLVKMSALKDWFKDKLSVNALNAHVQNLGKKGCVERPKRGFLLLVENSESVERVDGRVENVFD